jgi:hypothetical protein
LKSLESRAAAWGVAVLQIFLREGIVRLTFEMELPEQLHDELTTAAKECHISPSAWAAFTIEAGLAARRLPYVVIGSHGAFTSGVRKVEEETTQYRVVLPRDTTEML